jgi:hypothetical protein
MQDQTSNDTSNPAPRKGIKGVSIDLGSEINAALGKALMTESDFEKARAAELAKAAKPPVSKSEIEYVNREHRKLKASAAESAARVIDIGSHLLSMKAQLKRGAPEESWEGWVEKNLAFPIRTAQKCMKAAEEKEKLAALGPTAFMSWVWGNDKPQKRRNGASGKDKDKEDKPSDKQHGGVGFYPDSENPGKLVIAEFKTLVGIIDREVFENESVTDKAKLRLIEELITWLQDRAASLGLLEEEETGETGETE